MPQKKPWLILDVDDVCYDFTKSLYLVAKEKNLLRDPSLHYSNWKTHNHPDYINFDDQESFREFMVKENVLSSPYVCEGAKEFLKWAKEYFSIGLITARGFHPNAEEVTREFFQTCLNITPDKIIISGLYGDKKTTHVGKFMAAPILGFVDDSINHVNDFHQMGISAFLMEREWNKDTDRQLKKVKSFEDIKTHLINDNSEYFENIIKRKNKPTA